MRRTEAHTLVNKIKIIIRLWMNPSISSERRAIHKASEFRCHFFDHLSCLRSALRFTQCITGHFTYIETSAEYQCIRKKYCDLLESRDFQLWSTVSCIFMNLSNFWRINTSSSETPYYSIALIVNSEEQCSTSQTVRNNTRLPKLSNFNVLTAWAAQVILET